MSLLIEYKMSIVALRRCLQKKIAPYKLCIISYTPNQQLPFSLLRLFLIWSGGL